MDSMHPQGPKVLLLFLLVSCNLLYLLLLIKHDAEAHLFLRGGPLSATRRPTIAYAKAQ